ncbi:YpjP family protein [Lysinibacillus sp. LZ02]|uniref:YpjP family protein n=1 Tax=Lysinibacillus sp. LZ02 TaxID=3420668 RepID=UPI003D36B1C3
MGIKSSVKVQGNKQLKITKRQMLLNMRTVKLQRFFKIKGLFLGGFGTQVDGIGNFFCESCLLPKLQEAIDFMLERLDIDTMRSFTIIEKRSSNYSEKVFHIKNNITNTNIIHFYVQVENLLDKGYYYHYHTFEDNFATQYDLGGIYRNQNTSLNRLM